MPPAPPNKPKTFSGSILSTAVPTTSLSEQFIKVLLYGRNRVGKTTLACQFPKPLLIVSAEPDETGGAMSVSKMADVHIVRITHKPLRQPDGTLEKYYGVTKAVMLAHELQVNNPFKTVVFDTVTSLQEIAFIDVLGASDVLDTKSFGMAGDTTYQARAEKTRATLRPYLDLNSCHVVFLAQEKDHNPVVGDRGKSKILQTQQQQSFFAADLGGTNAKWLQDGCGYIVQLYEDEIYETKEILAPKNGKLQGTGQYETIGTGKRGRHLRCLYHPNFAGGFRSPVPEVVPEFYTASSPRDMYEKLMKLVRGVAIQ